MIINTLLMQADVYDDSNESVCATQNIIPNSLQTEICIDGDTSPCTSQEINCNDSPLTQAEICTIDCVKPRHMPQRVGCVNIDLGGIQIVDQVIDLLDPETWERKSITPFNGLLAVVIDDDDSNGLYRLNNAEEYTTIEGWARLLEDKDLTVIINYISQLIGEQFPTLTLLSPTGILTPEEITIITGGQLGIINLDDQIYTSQGLNGDNNYIFASSVVEDGDTINSFLVINPVTGVYNLIQQQAYRPTASLIKDDKYMLLL